MIENENHGAMACGPEIDQPKEISKGVDIVFDFLRDIMYKIKDMDGKDAQEQEAIKLFKLLGNVTDIPTLAGKLLDAEKNMKMAEISADNKDPQVDEETAEEDAFKGMFEKLN